MTHPHSFLFHLKKPNKFQINKREPSHKPETKPALPTMITETLALNPNFFLNPKPHHPIPSKSPSFLTLPLFRNPISTPKLRTRATINEEYVLPKTHPDSTFYELLGISTNVSVIEIKQAYKQLARKYHPDVSPPDRAEEYTKRFILVQEAYETLSDPNRRALYDRDMSRGLHLAFSARRGYAYDEELLRKNEWKNHWQAQVEGLKNKRATNDSNMSWAAQMRRRRFESDEIN